MIFRKASFSGNRVASYSRRAAFTSSLPFSALTRVCTSKSVEFTPCPKSAAQLRCQITLCVQRRSTNQPFTKSRTCKGPGRAIPRLPEHGARHDYKSKGPVRTAAAGGKRWEVHTGREHVCRVPQHHHRAPLDAPCSVPGSHLRRPRARKLGEQFAERLRLAELQRFGF